MRPRSTALLAAATMVAATAGGCGGGGSTSEPSEGGNGDAITTSSLSKAQYISRASAACQRQQEKIGLRVIAFEKQHPSGGARTPKIYAEEVKAVWLPMVEGEIRALHELGAPAGDEAKIEAMLAADEASVARAASLKRIKSLEAAAGLFSRAGEMLRAYGLEKCTIRLTPTG
ncbi:MAG: hypothetical protein WBM00_08700 [Solirubrobacterales bacterium]